MNQCGKFIVALTCLLCLNIELHADVIIADTTGTDNFLDPDFYGVEYLTGSRTVASVSWNLTDIPDAVFDFDEDGSFDNGSAPVFSKLTSSIQSSEVQFLWDFMTDNPNLLTAFFPNGLQAGQSFRFAADTDFLGAATETGGEVFGLLGVRFDVEFTDGTVIESRFEFSGQDNSSSAIAVAVPEPTSCLALTSLVTAILLRRRR